MHTKFGIGRAMHGKQGARPCLIVEEACLSFDSVSELRDIATVADLLRDWDVMFPVLQAVANDMAQGAHADKTRPVASAGLIAPLDPPQVFCTGANYRTHVAEMIVDRFSAQELAAGAKREDLLAKALARMDERARTGMPYIFTRILSSYAGPFDDLTLPSFATQPDWEAELGVVFKTGGQRIGRGTAMDHVAGYLVVNDITNRDQIFTADPKDLGTDWLHAKNNPGYFPMGPMIVPKEFVPDPHDLRITLTLNGEVMQDETTGDMIFDIPRQIEVLSTYARIMPGDVMATGSPSGNGTHYGRYLRPGDVMEVTVEGLGTQRTQCVSAE